MPRLALAPLERFDACKHPPMGPRRIAEGGPRALYLSEFGEREVLAAREEAQKALYVQLVDGRRRLGVGGPQCVLDEGTIRIGQSARCGLTGGDQKNQDRKGELQIQILSKNAAVVTTSFDFSASTPAAGTSQQR